LYDGKVEYYDKPHTPSQAAILRLFQGIIIGHRKAVRMSPQDIEKTISEVNGTLAIEGMPLDETDKENLRSILRGEVSFEEMKRRLASDYCQPQVTHG
jgi:hypothetical protein